MQVEGFFASLVALERLGLIIGRFLLPCQHEVVCVVGLSYSTAVSYGSKTGSQKGKTKKTKSVSCKPEHEIQLVFGTMSRLVQKNGTRFFVAIPGKSLYWSPWSTFPRKIKP